VITELVCRKRRAVTVQQPKKLCKVLTVTVESSSSPTVLRKGAGQAHAALRMLLSHPSGAVVSL